MKIDFEAWIENVAGQMPIEMFSVFGGFVEEIIAPIPSPVVMMTAGSLAEYQGYGYPQLVMISALGALGKTAGALILYWIAVKAEDFFLRHFGKFFGIDREQIEKLSSRLNKGWKDDVTLTVLRALPFMPSSILSVGCGLLKIHLRSVILSSLIGNFIRNWIFLYIGYAGKSSYESILSGLDSAESIAKIAILAALAGVIAWVYFRRGKK